MSLDNALAITAAAKGDISLVIFGLMLSVPIIIGGSAIILRLMKRFPLIITAGGGLLGWLGGDLIIHDKLLTSFNLWPFAVSPSIAAATGAIFVVCMGKFLSRHQSK